jgi:uncharacterized repeat protein (TIGR01451 family)
MNPVFVCCRRIAVLMASLSVVLVSLVASASAQDIAVTKSTDSMIVAAGSNVTYGVTVSNSSGSTGETTLTDAVPPNMTFFSASYPDGWICTLPAVGSGGTISCTYAANLPDESVFSFSFVFQVVPGTPNDTVIVNTANISNAADPNSNNDMSSVMVTVGEPPPPPPPPLSLGDVLISEFRLSGPNDPDDDFIELYCNRDTDCDISGVSLHGYDPVQGGDFSMTFPPETVIPARQYYLVGDSRGYSLISYGFPDIDVALSQPPEPNPPFYFYDNEGIQLVGAGEGNIIDSVGFTGGGNDFQYVEGTGLQRASSRPADQYAYVRKRTMATNGRPQDTNNNAGDFVLVSVTGTAHAGISAPPVLGAPGPQGLYSPLTYSNSQVTGVLVDPTKDKEEDPNRVREGSGDSGMLSLRRSFTNNTTSTFYYVGFRVIEISTLNSPNTLGDQAELRLVSSGETSAVVPSRGGPVTIYGTILEYDEMCACLQPQQPNGGGLNSSVFTDFSNENSIGPGETFDVQWRFNVVKAGLYRFYVYVEAGEGGRAPVIVNGASPLTARYRSPNKAPTKFANMRRVSSATSKPKQKTPVLTPATTPSATPLNVPTPRPVTNAPAPRLIIINRGIAEGEKPRKKKRVRRKSSAALKKKAEEKFAVAAEKPQN